jgi:hypothetical protein
VAIICNEQKYAKVFVFVRPYLNKEPDLEILGTFGELGNSTGSTGATRFLQFKMLLHEK